MTERILVMMREHIGDVVNSIPALRCIRRHHPSALITVEVGDRAAGLLRNCPYLDELWPRPEHQGLLRKVALIGKMRLRRFRAVYILDDSNAMILYCWLGGLRERYGIVKTKYERLFTQCIWFDPSVHETLGNFRQLLDQVGVDTADWHLELFDRAGPFGDGDREDMAGENPGTSIPPTLTLPPKGEEGIRVPSPNNHIVEGDGALVAINPGASIEQKRWFPERFAEVADRVQEELGATVCILGGPGEVALAEEIRSTMRTEPMMLTGKLSLDELIAVLERCDALVTCDSGPKHIAAAVGTSVVGIFGYFDPAIVGPAGEGHILLRKVAGCPDCRHSDCAHDRSCLRLIEADDVVQAVATILERSGAHAIRPHRSAG